jgi:hypothetical protein
MEAASEATTASRSCSSSLAFFCERSSEASSASNFQHLAGVFELTKPRRKFFQRHQACRLLVLVSSTNTTVVGQPLRQCLGQMLWVLSYLFHLLLDEGVQAAPDGVRVLQHPEHEVAH